jgi:hypothetical protein
MHGESGSTAPWHAHALVENQLKCSNLFILELRCYIHDLEAIELTRAGGGSRHKREPLILVRSMSCWSS